MNVILTCTFAHPGHEFPHQILEAAGVMPARPSRRENMSPGELHQSLLKAHGIKGLRDADSPGVPVVSPGTLWQNVAVDLFLGNLDSETWGWVEPAAIHLLDFWRGFDSQIRFLLAYRSPAAVLGSLLRGQPADDESVRRVLLDWCHFNTELLRFYHANRDGCLLVNAGAIDQQPQTFVKAVATKFGLGHRVTWPEGKPLPGRPLDAHLLEYLALQLVEKADAARSIYDELESTADLPGAESGQRTATAWNEYRNLLQLPSAGTASVGEQLKEATQENELLLLQLHQVQEELEHYFLEAQRLTHAGGISARVAPRDNPLADVLYDLRKEIDGENWYYAERDGRWAGPGEQSLLRVPALAPGRYRLELCVVDAMDPGILNGMTVARNGVPMDLSIPTHKDYPRLISAEFGVDEGDQSAKWEFSFRFSRLVSPADRGSDDQRKLAIRVASLRLQLRDDAAPWASAPKSFFRRAFGKKPAKG